MKIIANYSTFFLRLNVLLDTNKMLDPKIGKFRVKFIWLIFLGIQIFLIAVMIGSILTNKWVSTDIYGAQFYDLEFGFWNYDTYFDGTVFKGNLGSCVEGCNHSYSQEISD